MVADQDQSLVGPGDGRVAPLAVRSDPPLEDGSRDVERVWDDPVPLAREIGADVDEERAGVGLLVRLGRCEPVDRLGGTTNEIVEGAYGKVQVTPAPAA